MVLTHCQSHAEYIRPSPSKPVRQLPKYIQGHSEPGVNIFLKFFLLVKKKNLSIINCPMKTEGISVNESKLKLTNMFPAK